MKKISFILACATLGACSSEDNLPSNESPIRLTSEITPMTRVTSQNLQSTQIANGQQVGVTITDAKTEHTNVAWNVGTNGEMTNSGAALYWDGKDVTVTAYHPYKSDWSGESVNEIFSVNTDQSYEYEYLSSDLLWSSTTASPSTTPISLNFTHKLSKISVILTSDDIADLSNATINICNTIISCYFNPTTGVVTTSTDFAPRTINAGTTEYGASTASAIIIPQTLTSGTRFIHVQHDGKDYYYSLPADMKFESGYSYTYTLKVKNSATLQMVKCVSSDIADWNNVNQSGDIEEGVATSNTATITLSQAGTLKTELGNQMLAISELKIVGPLNGTDIKCLRQMAGCVEFSNLMRGNLTVLDLSEATIVEGGEAYSGSFFTSDNVIGIHMFSGSHLYKILLPKTVTKIEDSAFYCCFNLSNVTIPDLVKTIEKLAFIKCSLTHVTIGNSVKNIGEQAFSDCYSLNSVIIGSNVEIIGNAAFFNCPLTSLIIPNSVKEIEHSAFFSPTLSEVTCLATTPPTLGSGAFTITSTLKVPDGYKTTYEGTDWKNYFTTIEELSE